MTKSTKLLIAIVVASATLIVVLMCCRDDEPAYESRTLSDWYSEYERDFARASKTNRPDAALQSAAAEAIRHIGTNAIPVAIKWISYETPASYSKVRDWIRPVTIRLGVEPQLYTGEIRAWRAIEILKILGTNAAPAIPIVSNLMANTDHADPAINAAVALCGMGRPGAKVLASSLQATNNPQRLRFLALGVVQHCDPHDYDIIEPALKNCLQDPDFRIFILASNSLTAISKRKFKESAENDH